MMNSYMYITMFYVKTTVEYKNMAMNAFVDYQAPVKIVELFVSSKICDHIEKASFFSAWKKLNQKITINSIEYIKFEVKTTNPDFDDIVPTILKYMPNIIIEEPIELKEKIDSIINLYKNSYTNTH